MTLKFLKGLLTASLFAVSFSSAHATVIDFVNNDSYTTDTISGWDWLDLTQSRGYSESSINNAIQDGQSFSGWSVASNADVAVLFDDFFSTNIQATGTAVDVDVSPSDLGAFQNMFGLNKEYQKYWDLWVSWYGVDHVFEDWNETAGRTSDGFASVSNGYLADWIGTKYYDNHLDITNTTTTYYHSANGDSNFRHTASGSTSPYNWYSTSYMDGWWLVRKPSPASVSLATTVPEPQTFLLFGLGLLGLGYARKRKQS